MNTAVIPEVKENDVWLFRFKPDVTKARFEPYHCFDGQFIAKKDCNKIILVDTYWGFSARPGYGQYDKVFTIEKAFEQGDMTFLCNLQDVEIIPEAEYKYYDEKDVYNLSHQHRCYKQFAKKKGAVRSAEIMKGLLEEKIAKLIHDIDYANREIESAKQDLVKVESGDTSIYI